MPSCPEQPIVTPPNSSVGGPFYSCGGVPTTQRGPSPTAYPHAFGDGSPGLNETSICFESFTIQSWWSNNGYQPDLPGAIWVSGHNRDIENDAAFPTMVIDGQWINITNHEGSIEEIVLTDDAWMVEVDGECLRPTPEPGLSMALTLGALLIVGIRRFRS